MRIIPVLDLKGGEVVRGVAGRRAEYRAVEGVLATDARPESVASAFVEKLGLREAYVADLDAIGGAEPAWDIYRRLSDCGLALWVDAGVGDAGRAGKLGEFLSAGQRLARVIVGLESLARMDHLAEIATAVEPERLVFSLDMKEGRPLVQASSRMGDASPEDIAAAAIACGIGTLIVLDLARVGVGEGVGTEDLCRRLRGLWPQLKLVAGGGVRSVADLESLAAAGCDAALVASALHDGRITAADVELLASTRQQETRPVGNPSHEPP